MESLANGEIVLDSSDMNDMGAISLMHCVRCVHGRLLGACWLLWLKRSDRILGYRIVFPGSLAAVLEDESVLALRPFMMAKFNSLVVCSPCRNLGEHCWVLF